jgi:hypothetical protein
MEFTNRVSEFPNRKKLIKVDENNVPIVGEEPILVNIDEAEGIVHVPGTPIDVETLNKGNWRDDESLSFKQKEDNEDPPEKDGETQIITKANGETWIIPPAGTGAKKNISEPPGTKVKINNAEQNELSFISDPQTQISEKISSSDLVQSSGQNVNKIMSQKAVSDGLNGKVNIAQGSGNANKVLGTDSSGNVISMAPKWDKLWFPISTQKMSAVGTFTISNVFDTVPDATEVMLLGSHSTSNGASNIVMPLYILNSAGQKTKFLNPSTTSTLTATSWNFVQTRSGDQTYVIIRFNSNTQVQITNIGSSGAIYGIYVR